MNYIALNYIAVQYDKQAFHRGTCVHKSGVLPVQACRRPQSFLRKSNGDVICRDGINTETNGDVIKRRILHSGAPTQVGRILHSGAPGRSTPPQGDSGLRSRARESGRRQHSP